MIPGPTMKLIIKVAEIIANIFISMTSGKTNSKGGKK